MSESLLEGADPSDKDQSKDIPQMGHPVSGGIMMGSRETGSPFLSMIPQDDIDPGAELSYLGPSAPLASHENTQDLYCDDELLQDDFSMNFQPQVLPSQTADHIRSVYNRGNYAMIEQSRCDATPYLEGNSYSNFPNQPSVDYPSSYQESFSLPPPRTSPHPAPNLGLSEDVIDNSLFIGSIPPGGGGGSFSRGYNTPSLDNEDAYSPRPFDLPPQRSHYRDLDPMSRNMRYDYGGQMSYFPDGGVGIGSRSYNRSLLSEPEGWTRSHSLSRGMNFVDTYDVDPVRPYGYNALRPQVPGHSSQLSLQEMGLGREYESMPDFAYSGKLSPHALPARDPYGEEYDYGALERPRMVENRSYMGSLGMLDTEREMPMPRARSMMYLGTQEDGEYAESSLLDTLKIDRQPVVQEPSMPSESVLAPSAAGGLAGSLDDSAENPGRKADSPSRSSLDAGAADSVPSMESSAAAESKPESESTARKDVSAEPSATTPSAASAMNSRDSMNSKDSADSSNPLESLDRKDVDAKTWTKSASRSDARTPRMDPKLSPKSDAKFGSPGDSRRFGRRSASPLDDWRSRPTRSPRAQGPQNAPGDRAYPSQGARSPVSGSRSPRLRSSRSPQPFVDHAARSSRPWEGGEHHSGGSSRYNEGERHSGKSHFQEGNAHAYGEHAQTSTPNRFGAGGRSQGPRDRSPTAERSRSPYPGQSKGSGSNEGGYRRDDIPSTYQFACRDFENGICLRGDSCKFYHDYRKGRRERDE